MIRASGEEPVVIEYLKHPPSRERLLELAKSIGVPVRGLMREKGTPYSEMKLGDATLSDDELVAAILAKPILLQRPIVETPKGTKICRPSEGVFDLLDRPVASFTKEDGEIVTRA